MAAAIYIISGFLGAGKTTLIQKLLKEAFGNEKVVLIENDFGEISVDAALLKTGGIEVKEINSGCICCSLSGDFVKALGELLRRFQPDIIIIEPSGVGKLSDIIKACSDSSIRPLANIAAKITVADVKRCRTYLDNFGEFFEDQIQNADVVVLSRTENFPDRINDAGALVKGLNSYAAVLSKPWDQTDAAEILFSQANQGGYCGHDHGGHDHNGHCDHDHSAEEAFDTVTIRTKRIYSAQDLRARVSDMQAHAQGTILRAKGIVQSHDGYVNLQYLPGDIQITKCTTSGDMICIIGRNLNRQELSILFNGE